jgi:cytochrome c
MIISYLSHRQAGATREPHYERQKIMRRTLVLPLILIVAACGGGEAAPAASTAQATTLTPWQLEHGVGPITAPLAAVEDPADEAEEGKVVFDRLCASCHKPNERYVGPALGGVVGRRTPEYVMNMILDPAAMTRQHPEAKKLLATFLMEMPNQGLTPEQAREVLEYLRTLPAPPAQ